MICLYFSSFICSVFALLFFLFLLLYFFTLLPLTVLFLFVVVFLFHLVCSVSFCCCLSSPSCLFLFVFPSLSLGFGTKLVQRSLKSFQIKVERSSFLGNGSAQQQPVVVVVIGIFLPQWGNETRFSIKTFDFENWNFEQPLRPPFDKN